MRYIQRVLFSLLITCFSALGEMNQADITVLQNKIESAQGKAKLSLILELAQHYQTANNIADGIFLTNEGIALADSLTDPISIANLRLIRGTLNMDLLNYDSALSDFNWVIDYAREQQNALLLAKSLTKVGVYFGITDRFDLAEKYMTEANEIFAVIGGDLDISTNYNNLAVAITGEVKKLLREDYYTYCQSSEKREDIQQLIREQNHYYDKSKNLAGDDLYGIAIANLNIAISSYCYSGDFNASNRLFDTSLTDFRNLGATNFVFFTLLSQAQVNFYEGKYNQATQLFEQAHLLAAEFDAPFIWIFFYEYWLPHLIKTGEAEQAIDALYKFYYYKQLENNQQSQARSENAQVLHEVAQKEKAITKLSFENEIKSREINQEKVTNQFQQAVIVLIFIILIFLAYLLRTKYQSEKLTKEHNALLEKMANTDSLTGLKNRRAMSNNVEIEMAAFKRYKRPFSIALIDVDHFKKINDTFGHNTGDSVLKTIAKLIKSNLREGDIASRWGGEEFLVMFPETSMHEAASVMSRILAVVSEWDFASEDKHFNVSFTAGITQISEGLTWTELCHNADEALYEGKKTGRGKIVLTE